MKTLAQLKNERTGYRRKTQAMYNTSQWRRASKAFLAENPLCVECKKEGKTTPSRVTDHIIPHQGNEQLFWDSSNYQALCFDHHRKKTNSEQVR